MTSSPSELSDVSFALADVVIEMIRNAYTFLQYVRIVSDQHDSQRKDISKVSSALFAQPVHSRSKCDQDHGRTSVRGDPGTFRGFTTWTCQRYVPLFVHRSHQTLSTRAASLVPTHGSKLSSASSSMLSRPISS